MAAEAQESIRTSLARRVGRCWWLIREIRDYEKRCYLFDVLTEVWDAYKNTDEYRRRNEYGD